MIKTELQLRGRHLLEGRAKLEDLNLLFPDQHEQSHGRAIFRELTDVLAQRGSSISGLSLTSELLEELRTAFIAGDTTKGEFRRARRQGGCDYVPEGCFLPLAGALFSLACPSSGRS